MNIQGDRFDRSESLNLMSANNRGVDNHDEGKGDADNIDGIEVELEANEEEERCKLHSRCGVKLDQIREDLSGLDYESYFNRICHNGRSQGRHY